MLCQECEKWNKCVKPCIELEKYLKEVEVYRREVLASDIGLNIDIVTNKIETVDLPLISEWLLLMKKVKGLTVKQKRYLYLNKWKGFSYAEIGRRYNTSRSNVRDIIFRAKNHIIKAIYVDNFPI